MIYNTYYAKQSFIDNKEALYKMMTANREGILVSVNSMTDNHVHITFSSNSKENLIQFMKNHINPKVYWENEVYD